MLAHPSSGNIPYVYSSIKVISIDSPYNISGGGEGSYDEYLTQHWSTFKFGLPNRELQIELIAYLQEIDDNIKEFLLAFASYNLDGESHNSAEPSQLKYQERNLALWMSEHRLMDPKTVLIISR